MAARVPARRGWMGALVALVAAALMLTGVGSAAAADDPPTGGSISGVVTSDADGSPVAGLFVRAQNDDGSSMAGATTEADGSYRIDGLVAGPHRVQFETQGTSYITEYWNNASNYFDAATIDVQDGAVVSGIDAALSVGGSINGTVTRDDGTPVVATSVFANSASGGYGSAMTDSDGTYTIQGLTAGSYTVQFSPGGNDGLIGEYWDDATDSWSATGVSVTAGATVAAIDAVLSAGGSIEGTVTQASDGLPVTDGWVEVLSAWGGTIAQGPLTSDGSYRIQGIQAGVYNVRFVGAAPNLLPQYWSGAATAAEATPVTVVAGETVSGLDAALRALSSKISGTVTRASDGAPAEGISVTLSGENGYFSTSTDATGAYAIPANAGQYTVSFSDPYLKLAPQWWSGATRPQDATPVTLIENSELTGIDASLDATVSIRGSVLIDGEADLGARASRIAVIAEAAGQLAGMTYVHADGTYEIAVGPGTYTVRAEPSEGLEHALAPQYYSHATTAAEATPVVASKTSGASDIDFDLASLTADVTLSSGTAQPGDQLHVTATGFIPGEPVRIELHSTPVLLASVTAGRDGAVDTTVTIPANAPAGGHRIVLTGEMSTLTGSAALTLPGGSAPGGSDGSGSGSGAGSAPAVSTGGGSAHLAATGAEAPAVALTLSALLVVAGLVLVRIRRRQQA